jgi:hypothetical protein
MSRTDRWSVMGMLFCIRSGIMAVLFDFRTLRDRYPAGRATLRHGGRPSSYDRRLISCARPSGFGHKFQTPLHNECQPGTDLDILQFCLREGGHTIFYGVIDNWMNEPCVIQ